MALKIRIGNTNQRFAGVPSQPTKEVEEPFVSVYEETERPKNATRIWISYDFGTENNDLLKKLTKYFYEKAQKKYHAESFGNSVITLLYPGKCISNNKEIEQVVSKLLIESEIAESEDELMDLDISIYVFYRSRNDGNGEDCKMYSGQMTYLDNRMHPYVDDENNDDTIFEIELGE